MKSILFVDDEQRILDGLRDLLHKQVRTSLGVSPFDDAYIEAVGAKDKLAGWQALAAKIAAGG